MAKKRNLTEHEAAMAAYHTLKDESLIPPRSPEEVAQLEEEFGLYPQPKFSVADALRLAKGQDAPAPAIQPSAFADLKGIINHDLAAAARKGTEIPAEMWERMKVDRAKARHDTPSRT